MDKRGLNIGNYDTVANLWLLTRMELSSPETVTNYVSVPGRLKGPLDLSTALTNGDPVYSTRKLVATFESSEGNRLERAARISAMLNQIHGQRLNIVLPDDPQLFLVGRVQIEPVYNDPAHARVSLKAVCEPWRYNATETVAAFQSTSTMQTGWVYNRGRLSVVPKITVTGSVFMRTGYSDIQTGEWTLSEGTYILPQTILTAGVSRWVKHQGAGTLTFTYREAVL